jgi:hypothetical protein
MFVAELAQVMDLPEERYAPLSCIMDKHCDRLTENRRRPGRNEARRQRSKCYKFILGFGL